MDRRTLLWILCVFCASATPAQEKPFYQTLDAPPAPELSPAQALESFTLAPGFTVAPVAVEPLIEDPVAIAWDELGQLYVAEMRGFMQDAYGNDQKAPVGSVVRLSDKDGNGVFDHREVLLDNLVLPRAVAIVNEGLLVAEPPNLWLCPSSSGSSADIDCNAKQNLGVYGNQPGSVEHAENGLMMGIDNWLYSAKSKRRLRLRDGKLESEDTLFRGQWGISQDNDGRLFYNTNSNLLLGDGYDAQQIVRAGNSSAPGLGQRVSQNDQLYAVRINPGVNRAYVPGVLRSDGRLNGPTAASGMAVYRGDQFGSQYSNSVFVAEPAANAVVQLRLARDGLTLSTEHVLYPHETWGQVEFLASTDERFRPVDVAVGPDGALYVVDMYRGIVQDHVFLTDQLRDQAIARQLDKSEGKGRIWRIAADNGGSQSKPVTLAGADSKRLVSLLGHANAWQRHTAQRLLLSRHDSGLDRQLKRVVRKGGTLQSVHALWTLSGRDMLDRRTVLKATGRGDASIALAAIRAGQTRLKSTDLLILLAQWNDAAIVQELTLSLARHNGQPKVANALVELLLKDVKDPYRPSAIKAAVHLQELAFLKLLLEEDRWKSALESNTGFVQALVVQGFRAAPASGAQLLDIVRTRGKQQRWLQLAILEGLHEATREESFARVELGAEHPIFSDKDETLWPAVARARRAFTWPGDDLAANAKPLSPAQQANKALGHEYYRSRCATCHGENGKGIASLAPPLADSPWVTGASERLARIVMHGLQGPIEVAGTTWNGVMPGHAMLDEFNNNVAAGLMTYLHRAWGHTARAIDPEFIAGVREQTADRTALWTVSELLKVESNTHYRRYEGNYGRPGFMLEFVYNGADLEVKSAIFNGPMIEQKEDHFLYEPRQLHLEFVLADTGDVVGVRMLTAEGAVEMPRQGG